MAMLGARMHYAVPRILQEQGLLKHLYTDFYAASSGMRPSLSPSSYLPNVLRRALGRVPAGVPFDRITGFNSLGFQYYMRRLLAANLKDEAAAHLWAGRELCRRTLSHGLDGADAVFTYNGAGLELMRVARAGGIRRVMEQTILPKKTEVELLEREWAKFPEWATRPSSNDVSSAICEREQEEWKEAETILCGSEFVRDGIARCGGPVERCKVVPYGVGEMQAAQPRKRGRGPLRVLTVGRIGLRKGSPYVLEAARILAGRAEFRLVGQISVPTAVEKQLRTMVQLVGVVPREDVRKHYEWADVFLLPSICEGSATVTYEAMLMGLPIVCTPGTGSIIRNEVDGFIVQAGSSEAIVAALERLLDSKTLRRLHEGVVTRANDASFQAYRRRLLEALL